MVTSADTVVASADTVVTLAAAMVVTSAAMEWLILVPTIADEKFQTRAPLHYGEATALKLASVINVADCLDVTDVADAAAVAGAAEADSENLAIHLAADAAETGAASATQPVAEHAAAVVEQDSADFTKVAHCLASIELVIAVC